MKRATITLPDDLEAELEAFFDAHDAAPSLTSVVQAALRRYLAERRAGGLLAGSTPGEAYPTLRDPSLEVAEPMAPSPPGFGAPAPRRVGAVTAAELPALLAALPRLAGPEGSAERSADELADDLAAARATLGERSPRDPWSD